MKSLNLHIIKGTVGYSRINKVGERAVANFSVATEYEYKNRDGSWGKETTWHSVSAWQGFGMCDLEQIVKGAHVLVLGRERLRKYTDQSGAEKEIVEILAESVDILAAEKPANKAVHASGGNSGKIDEDIF